MRDRENCNVLINGHSTAYLAVVVDCMDTGYKFADTANFYMPLQSYQLFMFREFPTIKVKHLPEEERYKAARVKLAEIIKQFEVVNP